MSDSIDLREGPKRKSTRTVTRAVLTLLASCIGASLIGGIFMHWYHKGKIDKWGIESESYWIDAPEDLDDSMRVTREVALIWESTSFVAYGPDRREHWQDWKRHDREFNPEWDGPFPEWIRHDFDSGSMRSQMGSIGIGAMLPMWQWHRFDYQPQLFGRKEIDGLIRPIGVPLAVAPRFPGALLPIGVLFGLIWIMWSVVAWVGQLLRRAK